MDLTRLAIADRLDKIESAMDQFLKNDGKMLDDDDHRIFSEMYDLILGLQRIIREA